MEKTMETDLEVESEWRRQELSDVLIGASAYLGVLLGMGPILLWISIY